MQFLVVFLALLAGVKAASQQPQVLPIKVVYQNSEYVSTIDSSIGTPGQKISLAVDLFTTGTVVTSKDADVPCSSGKKPILFNYSISTTYSLVKNFTDSYDNNSLIQDVVQFGSAKDSTKRQFNMTNVYSGDDQCSAYSGSIGFGLVKNSGSLVSSVLKDYPSQVVTISPTKVKSSDPKLQQLSLTLGAADNTGCKSDWTEAKCSATSEFTYPACTFSITGYSFGSYTVKRSSPIASVALSLQEFTYVPNDMHDRIMRAVSYNESIGGIPCDGHPNLSIFINKSQYTLDGRYYTGKALGNNYCEFLIQRGSDSGLSTDLLVLPIGFFSQNCQQLNYNTLSTSLATASS